MTTSTSGSSSGPATAASVAASAGGGIVRLNPFDGLFLRAEHLEALQAYARELTHALGQAGGTGVVHGYGVTLSAADRKLNVSAGLAFDPDGRPLRMTTPTSVKLDPFTAAGGAWVIELVAKDNHFGDETVFGALCEDPCDGADRYFQSRRITAVRWSFGDGPTVLQQLDRSQRSVQRMAVDSVTP